MEQTTNTKASLPGFISLVKESLQIYRLKWKVFFKIIFVSFGVAMAIMLCFVPGVLLTLPILAFNIWVGITVIIVLTIAEFLAAAYFSSWFGAAMIVVLRDNQEDIGFREAMKRAKPYIIQYLWASIISGLIVMFGWVFFIIPGIIFSIWFMFPRYAVVVDNERGMTAVLKSKGYAKGYFWDIFLLAALGIIAIYIPQGIISSLKIPLVDLAMGLLIAPLWVIYPYLIFKHLKETKKDLIFAPTAREKNFFAVLGVITLLIIIVFVGLLVYFAPQIENAIEQYQKQLPGATIPFERNGAV